jgi:hypothetical protein
MKKSRFTETQIVAILNEAESGIKVNDVCRQHGISLNGSKLAAANGGFAAYARAPASRRPTLYRPRSVVDRTQVVRARNSLP